MTEAHRLFVVFVLRQRLEAIEEAAPSALPYLVVEFNKQVMRMRDLRMIPESSYLIPNSTIRDLMRARCRHEILQVALKKAGLSEQLAI